MLALSGRAMVSGTVIALEEPPITGRPVISVTVANVLEPDRSASFRATVDTGFTGFLTLTPGAIAQLGLFFLSNQPAVLADGAVGRYDIHAGRILWQGRERVVPVCSVDSDPLVGMALLWNSRLTMDAVPDGAVTIVPLPS